MNLLTVISRKIQKSYKIYYLCLLYVKKMVIFGCDIMYYDVIFSEFGMCIKGVN